MKTSITHSLALGAVVCAAIVVLGCSVQYSEGGSTYRRSVTTVSGRSVTTVNYGLEKYSATETQRVAAGATPQLIVDGDIGNTTVDASAAAPVTITAVKHAAARADLARLVLHVDHNGNTVHVYFRRPASSNNLYADLIITAPPGTQVQAYTDSGDIKVDGFMRATSVTATNGNISLSNLPAPTTAHTDSGSVTATHIGACTVSATNGDLDLHDVTGTANVQSDSGHIAVAGVHGNVKVQSTNGDLDLKRVDGSIDATTDSGSIDINGGRGKLVATSMNGDITLIDGQFPAGVQAHTDSGSVNLEGALGPLGVSSSNGDVSIKTSVRLAGSNQVTSSSGDVTIAMPRGSNVKISALTNSGSISNQFALAPIDTGTGSTLVGKIGSGLEATLTISTDNGDIHLNKK